MNRWIVPLLTAALALGAAQVSLAQGQGQGQGKDKAKDKPNAEQPVHLPSYPGSDDKHKGQGNHGQAVSECNHRANERNLKGSERKDFVEWCESRGARYKYDDKRYDGEKNCYQKANSKGLTGSKRENFLDKCLGKDGDDYYGGKVPVKRKD